jgi:hypothetical protein
MKIALTLFCISFFFSSGIAQFSTKDNYFGNWIDPSSWVSGLQPNPLTTNINDGIIINGYITREGNLSFANVGQANDLLINDTLVIKGEISFANSAANLVIPTSGLLIVFGDFSATNKIEIQNGGLLIIMGDMNFSPSNQDDYVNNGGGLYVDGEVSGNNDAGAIDKPIVDLINDGFEDIYDFVIDGGNTPLPIELITFSATNHGKNVLLSWATASELNNDYFTLEKSRNGKEFEVLTKVDGNGTTHIRTDYQFADQNPFLGLSYYRLRQTDYDGTSETFPAVSVLFTASDQFSVFPNPIKNQTLGIKISGRQKNEILELNMYNLQGRLVLKQQFIADAFGYLDTTLDVGQQLDKGAYILELVSATGKEHIKVQYE